MRSRSGLAPYGNAREISADLGAISIRMAMRAKYSTRHSMLQFVSFSNSATILPCYIERRLQRPVRSRTSPAFRMGPMEDRGCYDVDAVSHLYQQQRTRARNLSEESKRLASLKQQYNCMFRRSQASPLTPQLHDYDDDIPGDSSLYDPGVLDNRRGHTCCGPYCFHTHRRRPPPRNSTGCFNAFLDPRDAFDDEYSDESDCVYCCNCKGCKEEQACAIEKRYQAKHLVEEMLEKVQGCDDLASMLQVWLSENRRQLPPRNHIIPEAVVCQQVLQGLPRTTRTKQKKSHRESRPSALAKLCCWKNEEDSRSSPMTSSPVVTVQAELVQEVCESQESRKAKDEEEVERSKKLDRLKEEAEAAQRELRLLRVEHEKTKQEKILDELRLLEYKKTRHSIRQDQQAKFQHKNQQEKRNAKMKDGWNAKSHKHSYDFAPLLPGSNEWTTYS